ncbi:MAG: TonB-dependent receptor plug domain-containing protein [Bacteroidales bacterium]
MKNRILLIPVLLFALFVDISAQKSSRKITITGRVTDMYSSPVSGALIMADGKTTTIKTNYKGYYKIKVKRSTLQIGVFTTIAGVKEEPVDGRTIINFNFDMFIPPELNTGTGINDEKVIDEGYGSAKKSNISKPVTKSDVSGNEYASFSSIFEVLKTIPGLTVSGNSITIRGVATLGSSTPLFVVDGITVSSINQINPSTVKSIEVLKGPAASVYGLQGANGVILIRLKSGD